MQNYRKRSPNFKRVRVSSKAAIYSWIFVQLRTTLEYNELAVVSLVKMWPLLGGLNNSKMYGWLGVRVGKSCIQCIQWRKVEVRLLQSVYLRYLRGRIEAPPPKKTLLSLQYIRNYIGIFIQTRRGQCA